MNRRALALALLCSIPALAAANAAMGIGMEMWPLPIWAAYCAAMVVVEAILIGHKIGFNWPASLGLSLGANFVTAWLCAVGGCAAPFLHATFVGSQLNPNPFWNAVLLLLILAIPSAFFESIVWRIALRKVGDIREWPIVGRTFLVHLACVPLGMVILLIPDRPYRMTENWAEFHRRMVLLDFKKNLEEAILRGGQLPPANGLSELARAVSFQQGQSELWCVFYEPVYHRFDTGEDRRQPLQLNRSLLNRPLTDKDSHLIVKPAWLIRTPLDQGRAHGFVLTGETPELKYTIDPKQLGY